MFHGVEGMRRRKAARDNALFMSEIRRLQKDWADTAGIFAPTHTGLRRTGTSPFATWQGFPIFTRVE